MGGLMFGLLVIAVWIAWKQVRKMSDIGPAVADGGLWIAGRTRWVFLLSFALPLWGFYFLMNFWKSTEPNWPAASYFSGMILAAGVLVGGWNSTERATRRRWRSVGYRDDRVGYSDVGRRDESSEVVSPRRAKAGAADRHAAVFEQHLFSGRWDPGKRLRGFEERAAALLPMIREMRAKTGREPLIVTGRYDTSSSLAFYLPGHPFVYCLMSQLGGRQSQYDLWPGLNERDGAGNLRFAGQSMLIVAGDGPEVRALLGESFERIEGPELIPVHYEGIVLHTLSVFRGYGFKGIPEARRASY